VPVLSGNIPRSAGTFNYFVPMQYWQTFSTGKAYGGPRLTWSNLQNNMLVKQKPKVVPFIIHAVV